MDVTILSPGMALKKPTDSLHNPGEGVGGNGTLTVSVERRMTCSRKLAYERQRRDEGRESPNKY